MEQFSIVKRGYDTEEVDKYIAALEQVVKSYKEKDNAIKNAIISAQVAADNILKNARCAADEYKGLLAKELVKVQEELDRQRAKVRAFCEMYQHLIAKHLTAFDTNEVQALFDSIDGIENMVNSFIQTDLTPGVDTANQPTAAQP
jgi:cell division septum initiation protein DivIVA